MTITNWTKKVVAQALATLLFMPALSAEAAEPLRRLPNTGAASAEEPRAFAAEARALADALFTDRARRFVCVEGTAHGNPALRVGTQVRLEGLGRRFSNEYTVTRCVHRWDVERGYETDFEAESAFVGVS